MTHFSVPAPGFRLHGSQLQPHSGIGPSRHRCHPLPRRCNESPVIAQAKGKKASADPPDIPKEEARRGGREWLQQLLSKFGPITENAENTHVLDFEKPLVQLDNRIKEVLTSHQLLQRLSIRRPLMALAILGRSPVRLSDLWLLCMLPFPSVLPARLTQQCCFRRSLLLFVARHW